jgi:predicted dehydrogenase
MTVKLALVGGAHIHTPGFIKRLNDRQDVAVKYVWDHDAERAQRRAAALNAEVVGDLDAIWDDASIAAAIICSETDRHAQLVTAAAAAGKHLFVEKPLGMGAEDAYAMAEAIEQAGVLFQTGYFQRGNPIHQFLRDQIAGGAFGKVTRYRHTNCHAGALKGWFDTEWRWMAELPQAGCGAFGDLGTHALDIMLWLVGDVTEVAASLNTATGRYGPECDEYGEGLLRFANGAIGSLAAGWVDIAHPISLVLSGTEGHAYVANGQLFFQSERVAGADGKTPWTDLPAAWPHAFELFLNALTGNDVAPAGQNATLVSVREAAYRSAVMEALYRSAGARAWIAPDVGS